LTVDYESGIFNISAAIPTSKEQLVTLSSNSCSESSSSSAPIKASRLISGGQIAGIVLGVVLGASGLGSVLIFLRSSKSISAILQRKSSDSQDGIDELDGEIPVRNQTEVAETESRSPVELGSASERGVPYSEKDNSSGNTGELAFSELSGDYLPHELASEVEVGSATELVEARL
jgi:hypothetical protein